MLDIDQLRISAVGVYLKWRNIERGRQYYTYGFPHHHQTEHGSFDITQMEQLKMIVSFLSEGDFYGRKEALDVALDKEQASAAAAVALAAYNDRRTAYYEVTFNGFMESAKTAATMIENPDLIQSVTNFLMNKEGPSPEASWSVEPDVLGDIKETIMQKKLKGDNDGDGKIDNSFEAIMRRLGN